jgi:hypothetical protein
MKRLHARPREWARASDVESCTRGMKDSTSDKSGIRRGGQIVHNLYFPKKARYRNIWGCMGPRVCLDASVKREIPLSGIEP